MMRFRRERDGSALIELAAVMPLVLFLVVIIIDCGRVFYTSMALTGAARAGAQWGAQSPTMAMDTGGMEAVAAAAAEPNLVLSNTPMTPTAVRECWCASADNPAIVEASGCNPTTCSPGEHMTIGVTVTTSATFSRLVPLFPIPGFPPTVTLTRVATLRAE